MTQPDIYGLYPRGCTLPGVRGVWDIWVQYLSQAELAPQDLPSIR